MVGRQQTGFTARSAPRWSIVVPAYNPGSALALALRSALAAAGGRTDIEIIVVDDCSTEPLDLEGMAGQVQVLRNATNRGAVGTFNRAIEVATGEFLHILHADDLVHPGFYESMERGFTESAAGAATCRVERIDGDGNRFDLNRREQDQAGRWDNALETLAMSNRVPATAVAVRRSVYNELGGFDESLSHAADWDMWLRVAAAESFYYDPEVLIAYRVHEDQHTASVMQSGDNIRQAVRVIERHTERVKPLKLARTLQTKAFAYRAVYAARTALTAAKSRDAKTARNQLLAAITCSGRAGRSWLHQLRA